MGFSVIHSSIYWFLANLFSLNLIMTSCDLNINVHPESHIYPIGPSELCVRLGDMCPSHASLDKSGNYSKYSLLYCMFFSI